MDASTRRIDITAARPVTSEVRDAGDEAMSADRTEDIAAIRPSSTIRDAEVRPDWDEWDESDREAWKRLMAIRERISLNWTSPLTAAEVLEEQRAARQTALGSPPEA